ncbi:hypothetical protein P879_07996 [Paragonimus westermani]|uniref:RRM domain-containing protein n=1 Tax=Paragonimus westermani TaxID=34504 RepID=A0A8T0D197_9TREM|nr:hypothetical protein P879_07996 [Paragonimus westermani]
MFEQQKRSRTSDWENLEPSPVIHVRGLPAHTLELDLLKLFEPYGDIREVAMMPHRKQSLVEFVSVADAESFIKKASAEPPRIGSQEINVSFSTSKRIVQRALDKDTPVEDVGESMENNVLLYTIYNSRYPITIDVVQKITSPFATVVRIVMFRKAHVQAMVELKTSADARLVKRNLNGADIYSGCCTLKVDYARPTRLTVTRNDNDTWDFEQANSQTANGTSATYDAKPQITGSLLGTFQQPDQQAYYNVEQPQGFAMYPDRCLINVPQNALECTVPTPAHLFTSVAMVYNMNMEQMNCDRLFNLLCPYGNVVRIKFLRSYDGSAMAQMGDEHAVNRLLDNLSGCTLMGLHLLIRPSRQTSIMDVPQPYTLPDGTPSFKDFTQNRNNRYSTPTLAGKNRSFKPSCALHYWNCPLNFSMQDMQDICTKLGAPLPTKMAPYIKTTGRTSSGLVQWEKESDALAALAIVNHYDIPNPDGGYAFILKLSFAGDVIHNQRE